VGANLYRLVDLDTILYGCDGAEGDPDAIPFNPVALAILNWRTFELLRWVKLLDRLVDSDEILYVHNDSEGDLDAVFFIPYLQPFQNVGCSKF
jgi:hypothetical protein